MNVTLQIKNYRGFVAPVTIDIREGVTSLVGVNNAGKSSLLRFFYDFRHFFQSLINPFGPFFPATRGGWQDFNSPVSPERRDEMFCKLSNELLTFSLVFDLSSLNKEEQNIHSKTSNNLFEHAKSNHTLKNRRLALISEAQFELDRINGKWRANSITAGEIGFPSANLFEQFSYGEPHPVAVYLPRNGDLPVIDPLTINSIAAIFSRTLYIPPFRHSVNQGESGATYFDLKLGKAFIQEWQRWKNGDDHSKHEAIVQVIEQLKETFGYRDLDINVSESGETFYVTANRKRYDLRDLGAGFSQWLIILSNAAISQPALILIDEPENHLHPSLQQKLLAALTHYASNGVIFATHSYGLARAAADYVYVVHRLNGGAPKIDSLESARSLSELLGELSFSAWREIGVEKLLLVEGRTDAEVIRHFLRLLGKDTKILVLSVGGGNLIGIHEAPFELDEIKRLGVPVYALIDSDREHPDAEPSSKAKKFKGHCGQANIDCHILERRATDNYLTTEAISKVLGPTKSAIGPFERLDKNKHWIKYRNSEIAREMTLNDLDGTDLKEFLGQI